MSVHNVPRVFMKDLTLEELHQRWLSKRSNAVVLRTKVFKLRPLHLFLLIQDFSPSLVPQWSTPQHQHQHQPADRKEGTSVPGVVQLPAVAGIAKVDDARWKCLRCGQAGGSRGNILKHYRRKHETLPKVKCPISECGKVVRNQYALPDHLRKAHCVKMSDLKRAEAVEAVPHKK